MKVSRCCCCTDAWGDGGEGGEVILYRVLYDGIGQWGGGAGGGSICVNYRKEA